MKNIAVITGAGTGIGRATAKRLAQADFDLVLIGRNLERLEATAGDLKSTEAHCTLCRCDVSDGDHIAKLAEKVERTIGPIDVWVNCAGATVCGETASLTCEELERSFSVSCLGSIKGTLAALHCMRRRAAGHIINLDLDVTLRDLPLMACENAARAALRSFCRSLRVEIHENKDRIALTTIEIPATNTPYYNWTENRSGKRLLPITPIYQPEVVAETICKAIFKPADSYAIGGQNLLTRLTTTFLPGLRKWWVEENGYHQFSHDWLHDDPPSTLFKTSQAPYETTGPFSDKARSLADLRSFSLSSKLRHGLRLFLLACGAGLLFKHCRSHKEEK